MSLKGNLFCLLSKKTYVKRCGFSQNLAFTQSQLLLFSCTAPQGKLDMSDYRFLFSQDFPELAHSLGQTARSPRICLAFCFFAHHNNSYLFIYLFTSLLECNCSTMLCQFLLYNKVNQLYIYVYPHIPSLLNLPPTLPISPLQVITKHQADLPVLCSSFPLAIHLTFGSVYMLMLLSHFIPASPFPTPPCP